MANFPLHPGERFGTIGPDTDETQLIGDRVIADRFGDPILLVY